MSTLAIRKLLPLVTAAALSACGRTDGPGGQQVPGPSSRAVILACDPRPIHVEGRQVLVGNVRYLLTASSTELGKIQIIHPSGTSSLLDSTIDVVFAIAGQAPFEASPTLYAVGCRGLSHLLVTFTDQDADGVVDEKLAEYSLPSGMRLVSLAPRLERSEIYAVDELGDRIVRLVDTNSDRHPDSVSDFVIRSSGVLVAPLDNVLTDPDGRVVIVSSRSPAPDGEVTVAVDVDGDGTTETVTKQLFASYIKAAPQFHHRPFAPASSDEVAGTPGSTLEVWRTNASGQKLSTNPTLDRVSTGTLGTTAVTATLTRDLQPTVGGYVTVFDVTTGKKGATSQVVNPYPVVDSVAPDRVVYNVGTTLTVTGAGFDANTQVVLESSSNPSLSSTLTPVILSATSLQVNVPSLSTAWVGNAHLRVSSSASPTTESHVAILVYLPGS